MQLVDAYASLSHFKDHLAPIWRELDRLGAAGDFFTPRPELGGKDLTVRDQSRTDRPMLVASFSDAMKWQRRPVVYVEHGAGQSYGGADGREDENAATSGSYSGGIGLDNVSLFLSPSQRVADRWLARYPNAMAVAVGSPRLDRWHQQVRGHVTSGFAEDALVAKKECATVAIAYHWDLGICPETRWAVPEYGPDLGHLKAAVEAVGARIIGHGHPRATRALADLYGRHGIQYVPDVGTVFDQADLLIVDNSSIGYEFASLGKPTIWMNASYYRRDVEHGMRFWSDIPGPDVNTPTQLVFMVETWLRLGEAPDDAQERERVVSKVYCATDGRAAERAAAAIMGLL